MRKRFSVVVIPALVLVACGGGDGDDGSGDEWCALAQRIEDESAEYEASFDIGGDAFETAVEGVVSLLDDARDAAPAEIRDAVITTAEGVTAFREVIADADYDLTKVDEAAFAALEALNDDMDAATEQIEAYNLRECGITPSSDGANDSDPSASSAVPSATDESSDDEPQEVIEEPSPDGDELADSGSDDDVTFVGDSDSDWCVAARQVEAVSDDFEMLGFGDPEALEEGFGEMLGAFEFALQFAPPELAADLEISFAAFQGADAAMKAAEYDFLNADLSALDDVDGTLEAANGRIESYNEQVCGIVIDDDPAPDDPTLADEPGDGVDFDPAAGTVREQLIAEFVSQGFSVEESECLLDGIDFTDPALFDDVDAVVAVFVECGVSLERLVAFGS